MVLDLLELSRIEAGVDDVNAEATLLPETVQRIAARSGQRNLPMSVGRRASQPVMTDKRRLERIVANLGLTRFGEPGDAFDPNLHEALSHIGTDPEVQVPTAKHVAKAGYRIGDRVVRAAQVLVVDPEDA